MRTLGLTGGIGSGKTAAARMFAELGAHVVSADDEAKRLMVEDPHLRAELVAAFGPETYSPAGDLNRGHLASRVFGDSAAVATLNALVHPRVRASFPEIRQRARAAGADLLVYEAALLVEAGLDDRFDAVAVVDAPVEVRIRRVMERDGVDRVAVEKRMQHQLPAGELRAAADFVIDNSGDLDDLRRQVARIYGILIVT